MRSTPFFTAYDSGSGGGGGSSSSPGAGASSSTGADAGRPGPSGGGTGSPSGGTSTPYKLSDDALIDLGDGKPTTWKEARSSRFVPKEDHDRYVSTFRSAQPMLESYARQLDEGFARLRQAEQNAGRGTQPARPDITEEISNLPILDGAAGAKIIKALREGGLAPIASMLTTQQGQIAQLTTQLQQMRGATGQVFERHQNQDFESHVTENLKELGEVKGVGAVDVNNPTVRELAKDLWGAYDPKTWTIPEYRRMLKDRIEGFVQLVLDSQKRQVERAKEQRRAFFNPNRGGGNPSGQPSYRHLSGLDLARESGIFDRQSA